MTETALEETTDMAVESWEGRADDLVIVTGTDYEAACGQLKGLKALRKEIVDHFEPMKKKAFETHREICSKEKESLAPLDGAEDTFKNKLSAWNVEQTRIAEKKAADIRRVQDEARRKEDAARIEREKAERESRLATHRAEEEKLKAKQASEEDQREATNKARRAQAEAKKREEEAAEKARIADEEAAAAEKVRETLPAQVDEIEVPPEVKGISHTTKWEARIDDEMELVKAIARGELSMKAIKKFDQSFLNSLAKQQQDELKIPGVTAVPKHSTSARG